MLDRKANTVVSNLVAAVDALTSCATQYSNTESQLNCARAAKELAEAAVLLKDAGLDMCMSADKAGKQEGK